MLVAVAAARAVARYAAGLVRPADPLPTAALRLDLGRSLAPALEFPLGADILRTALEPTWEQFARLAAVAAIRTALNYFLQRELAHERAAASAPPEARERARLTPGEPPLATSPAGDPSC